MPKYDLMGEIAHFIKVCFYLGRVFRSADFVPIGVMQENQETYKATNKDLWSMMLEFCETVKPSLQDYEADGVCSMLLNVHFLDSFPQAWPTLLDDFVIWKSNQLQGVNGADKMDVSGN